MGGVPTLPFLPPRDALQQIYEDERARFLAGEMVCPPCLGHRLSRSLATATPSWRAIAVEVEPPAWTGDPAEKHQRLYRVVAQLLGDAAVSASPSRRRTVTCA